MDRVDDFDGDGWPDLAVGQGWGASANDDPGQSLVFYNLGEPPWLDGEAPVTVSTRAAAGVTSTDIDGDGWIDVFFASYLASDSDCSVLNMGSADGFSEDESVTIEGSTPRGASSEPYEQGM